LEVKQVVHFPEFSLEAGSFSRASAIERLRMLRHRVIPENHGQLFAVIVFQIAKGRPENETGHAFEIAEFLQSHRSFEIATHMRRLRARFRSRRHL